MTNSKKKKAEPKCARCGVGTYQANFICQKCADELWGKEAEPKPEGGLEAVIHEQLSRGRYKNAKKN